MTEIYPVPMIAPELQDRSLPMDTIGMPVAWIDYGVVDEHDELLPPNEVGELVFRPLHPARDGERVLPATPSRRSRRSATWCSTPGDLGATTRTASSTTAAASRTGSGGAARTCRRPSSSGWR